MAEEERRRLSGYHRAPEVTQMHEDRVLMILAAASGKLTVKEAAERAGLSRKQLRSLMNRGLAAMIEAIEPHSPGRPPKPTKVKRLEAENAELKQRNKRLQEQAETAEKVLEAAAGMLRVRASSSRQRGKTKKAAPAAEPKKEEPDGALGRLDGADRMKQLGAKGTLCAAVAGVSPATLRRWRHRARLGAAPRGRRSCRGVPPDARAVSHVEAMVRDLRGLIGADALRHAVPGVSRRQALAIKRQALTAMERERVAASASVTVPVPGVVRGFDAMHVETTVGPQYLLVAADSAVPFRTTVTRVQRYDSDSVAAALERDFTQNGAPLVLRMDRARQHTTPEVLDVLGAHAVLLLQGPPHHPGFYGQLERQNREHRAWLDLSGVLPPDELDRDIALMAQRFNSDLPRRTLGFQTAAHAWNQRPPLALDRSAFRALVRELACRLASAAPSPDHVERFAIQAALAQHGLIEIRKGTSALPDIQPR